MATSPAYESPSTVGTHNHNNEYAEMMPGGNAETFLPEQQNKVENPGAAEALLPEQQQYYKPDPYTEVNRQQPYQPDGGDNAPMATGLEGESGSRRRSKRFWIIAGAILILVVGIAVGVGVGVGVNKGSSNSSTKTSPPAGTSSPAAQASGTSASGTSTSSAASSASPTALTILSAVYGPSDVTADAKSKLQDGDDIVIDTDAFPFTDSWVGVTKCLSLLHRYSNANDTGIRTFIGCERTGQDTLVPGPVSLSNNTLAITNYGPSTTLFHILSVVWQGQEIRDQNVYDTLFETAKANNPVVFSNALFGVDTSYGNSKAAAIFYTADGFDTIKSIYGKEGDNATFIFL